MTYVQKQATLDHLRSLVSGKERDNSRGFWSSLGLSQLAALPSSGYSLGLMGSGQLAGIRGGEDANLLSKLKDHAVESGIQFKDHKMPGFVPKETVDRVVNTKSNNPFKLLKSMFAMGLLDKDDLPRDTIIGPEDMRPEVLAHELGHSTQKFMRNRLGSALYSAGKVLPGVGSLGALMSKEDDTAKQWALGGSLSAVPMLGTELHASGAGSKLLRRNGVRGLKTLGSFKGVPSYALLAASPWLAYGMRKKEASTNERKPMNHVQKQAAIKSALNAQQTLAMLAALAPAAGGGLGALHGYRTPDDSAGKLEGSFRGGAIGSGAGIGALLGTGAGAALGRGNENLQALAMLLGGGAGAYGGGKLVQTVLGKPGRQARKEEDRY